MGEEDNQLENVLAKIEDKTDLSKHMEDIATEHANMWQEVV